MRKYSSNLAFVDLLFNLLVGFTCLFVIAFLLINPISKKGVVDPPTRMIIELTWDDEAPQDIDLHVRGPDGTYVNYVNRDSPYLTLERDDLGITSDTYYVNGQRSVVVRNYEIVTVTATPTGEYVVNVHYYGRGKDPIAVKVKITMLSPYSVVGDREVILAPREENTVFTFTVSPEGVVEDVRTDIQIPLRSTR